jgi:hypothetical protein
MRRFTAMRSSSLNSTQRVISSNVRRQLRHTSSPNTVEQCPTQGEAELISRCEGGAEEGTAGLYRGPSLRFQACEPGQRLLARGSAHLRGRLQTAAECRALRPAKHGTAVILIQLRAAHPGGLALRHTRQGRSDGRRNAAGSAIGAAGQGEVRCI